MADNREQLQAYTADALQALERQQALLVPGDYEENRLMGLQVATGVAQTILNGDRRLIIKEGEVRSRITGNTTPEHTLEFNHIKSLGRAKFLLLYIKG